MEVFHTSFADILEWVILLPVISCPCSQQHVCSQCACSAIESKEDYTTHYQQGLQHQFNKVDTTSTKSISNMSECPSTMEENAMKLNRFSPEPLNLKILDHHEEFRPSILRSAKIKTL